MRASYVGFVVPQASIQPQKPQEELLWILLLLMYRGEEKKDKNTHPEYRKPEIVKDAFLQRKTEAKVKQRQSSLNL